MASTTENLLVLKRWAEDEAKNVFAQALKTLSAEEDILKSLEDRLESLKQDFYKLSQKDTDISVVRDLWEYQDYLVNQISVQKGIVLDKGHAVEEARKKLVEATKERKVFERLLEKERLQRQKQQERLERMQIEESTSVRFQRQEE